MKLPCLLNRESTIRQWLTDPRGKAVFEPMFDMMRKQMGQAFGDADGE